MRTKDVILRRVRQRGLVTTADVVGRLHIARQTAAQHLRELVTAKQLVKLGSTRNARYVRYSAIHARAGAPSFTARRRTRGLEEDRVFTDAALRLQLRRQLSPQAYDITSYAFTEMLNNAIEHSRAPLVVMHMTCLAGTLSFSVRDRGIGVFESVRRKFRLPDPYAAVEHLLKGKQTTAPAHHTGQGIFFTSRIADRFALDSGRIRLLVDNVADDVFVAERPRALRGTLVTFALRQRSRKRLQALFDAFSDEAYAFDKTQVRVRLARARGDYVSRSEARRLLLGLEKFRHVVLDFSGVRGIGQAFADEIFRVFRQQHPRMRVEAMGMGPGVLFVVRRAQAVSRTRSATPGRSPRTRRT